MMLYSIGFYFISQYDIQSIKQANHSVAGSGNSVKDIIIITASLKDGKVVGNDLQLSDENEITYKGHLYDVVSSKAYPDHVAYSCIADEKEDNINAAVNNQIEKQSDHAGKKGFTVSKTFNLFFEEEGAGSITFYTIIPSSVPISAAKCLPVPYHNIPSPPPWA